MMDIFRKLWLKARFFEDFKWNRDFSKIVTKIQIFEKISKFVYNLYNFFRKLWLQLKFFEIFLKFPWSRDFSDILTENKIFQNLWWKLRFFDDYS